MRKANLNFKSKIFLLVFAFLQVIVRNQQVSYIDITSSSNKWTFVNSAKPDKIYPAFVPSTVHLDLMQNGLLEDPYFRDNLMKAYWIELEAWDYSSEFEVNENILKRNVVEMVFEGLDTHANVTLNNKLILQANNMHRTWVVDVKDVLSSKDLNNITIHFASAPLHDLSAAQTLNETINITLPFNYSYSRKASYQYGWDWGPRLVTCGIWKPIKIRAYD